MKTKLFIAIIVFVALGFFAIPSESASAATLTITISGGGTGSSVSDLMFINCPPTCSYNYASGASVELFQNAGSGYIFTGWTGNADCSDGVVSMSSNKACTANFSVAYTLTVVRTPVAGGRIDSGTGISCPATCSAAFASGYSVTLTATAFATYTFTGWSGGGCSGTGTCTVTMSADRAITANFTLSYASCGLRAYDGSAIITFACEPTGTVTSLLRIFSSGNIYGIMLVDPTDASASKFRIRTSAGIRALMKL